VDSPEVDFATLKVTELRAQCKTLGIDGKGVKAVLVERLEEHREQRREEEEEREKDGMNMSLDLKSLAETKTVSAAGASSSASAANSPASPSGSILRADPPSADELAAMQIAFLLSYSFSFFENTSSKLNSSFGGGGGGGGGGCGIDTSLNGSRDGSSFSASAAAKTTDPATKHCRDLLHAVFSTPSKLPAVLGERLANEQDPGAESRGGDAGGEENAPPASAAAASRVLKTSKSPFVGTSFAAKHRALRAAMILAPSETLTSLLPPGARDLDKLVFASFAAKVMEAMQLPLPCASLEELGGMDLSNLARALFKDHARKAKDSAVFHDLVIKLLVQNGISDFGLLKDVVHNIVGGVKQHPGLLLVTCELLIGKVREVNQEAPKIGRVLVNQIKGLVKEVGRVIGEELGGMQPQPQGFLERDFVSAKEIGGALRRFVELVARLGEVGGAGAQSDWTGVGARLLELCDGVSRSYFDEQQREEVRADVIECAIMLGCESVAGEGRGKLWEGVVRAGGRELLGELVADAAADEQEAGGWESLLAEEEKMLGEVREALSIDSSVQ
jgi:hypothetical protein